MSQNQSKSIKVAKESELSAKQLKVLEWIFKVPLSDLPKKTGLSRPTIYRYLQDPVFMEAKRQMQQQILNGAVDLIIGDLETHRATLQSVSVGDEGIKASEQVSAAKTAFDIAFRGHDALSAQVEIEAIKQELEALKNGDRSTEKS